VRPPDARRILVASSLSLCVGVLIITAFQGLQPDYPMRLIQGIAAAAGGLGLVAVMVAFITTRLGDYRHSGDEQDFELIVRRSERLARENLAAEPQESEFLELDPFHPQDFEELVRDALDDLPDILRAALGRNVAVIISDQGRRHHAYGLYMGDTVARDTTSDRIVIFRDTLLRDFGHDPDELRLQVLRTVRHELAHHLGADELGVRELGL
jgi:predicted Zn-dependent protease with MMP-like domain